MSRLKAKKEIKRATKEEFEEWQERVRKVVQLDQEKAATKRDLDGLDQAALKLPVISLKTKRSSIMTYINNKYHYYFLMCAHTEKHNNNI